jgi:hypothetical protein
MGIPFRSDAPIGVDARYQYYTIDWFRPKGRRRELIFSLPGVRGPNRIRHALIKYLPPEDYGRRLSAPVFPKGAAGLRRCVPSEKIIRGSVASETPMASCIQCIFE